MEKSAIQKLLFIYNADTGFKYSILDAAHKIVSPATYQRNLCALTFGAFTEKPAWKKFRETLDMEMEFVHRNQYQKQYASKFGHKFTFPIVLSVYKNDLEVFIGTEELQRMKTVDKLMGVLMDRLKN